MWRWGRCRVAGPPVSKSSRQLHISFVIFPSLRLRLPRAVDGLRWDVICPSCQLLYAVGSSLSDAGPQLGTETRFRCHGAVPSTRPLSRNRPAPPDATLRTRHLFRCGLNKPYARSRRNTNATIYSPRPMARRPSAKLSGPAKIAAAGPSHLIHPHSADYRRSGISGFRWDGSAPGRLSPF